MKLIQNPTTKMLTILIVFFEARLLNLIIALTLIFTLFGAPSDTFAINQKTGEVLFKEHCSGCHINGSNIIRRSKTLKLSALKRRGLDNPEAIAKIAREGIGTMSGYEEYLGEDGDQLVAKWIWNQAQNAWTQG